jgi:hypothetical protein
VDSSSKLEPQAMYELKKGWFLSILSLLVKRSVKKRMFDGVRGNESIDLIALDGFRKTLSMTLILQGLSYQSV